MNEPPTERQPTLFWRACLRWVLLGLALMVVVILGGDPLTVFGPGDWRTGLGRLLILVPGPVALLFALAGFAGGFAVGRRHPPPEGSLRTPLITAALVTYALIAFAKPLVLYWIPGDVLAATPSRLPLGPELPWTLWRLRDFVVQEGLPGSGPVTPLVRGHLHGFSFYFPFMVATLGIATTWAGRLVGRRVAVLERPAVSRSVAWVVWLAQAGGFYAGIRIAIALVVFAGWSAERAALLPVSVPVIVAVVLASLAATGSDPSRLPSRPSD